MAKSNLNTPCSIHLGGRPLDPAPYRDGL